MAGPAPLPAFVHDPLPDSKTHIRLVQVSQGNFGQQVVCTLSAWPLDSAPPYNAISYTWGDPASTVDITVDGRNMVVRQNCEYVLQQAFTKMNKKTQYLWVDAICIDQSELQERSHQVAVMGKLYKRAAHVFACVGAHSDDSEYLSSTCSKEKHLLKEIFADLPHDGAWEQSSNFGTILSSRLAVRSVFAITPAVKLRVFKAYMAFMSRTYFTRVWILQELYMGSYVSFCCGADMIPSEQMIAISALIQIWCRRPWSRSWTADKAMLISRLLAKWTEKEISSDMYRAYKDAEPRRFCLSLAFEEQTPKTLVSILGVVHQSQCTDERDRIYGILSLVDWPSGIAPVPNYQTSILDLAIEALGILCTGSSRQGVFRYVELLTNVLKLSPVLESINDTTNTTPGIVRSKWARKSRVRITDEDWRATKIRSSSSQSNKFAQLHFVGAADDNKMALLVDDNNIPFAEASIDTRVGDWYVEMRSGSMSLEPWNTLGLIARISRSSTLSIVGLARKLGHHRSDFYDYFVRKENLEIHWDPWDALFLHVSVCSDKHEIKLDTIRICSSEHSSYAVFAFPKAVKRSDYVSWSDLLSYEKQDKSIQHGWYTLKAIETYPIARTISQKSCKAKLGT